MRKRIAVGDPGNHAALSQLSPTGQNTILDELCSKSASAEITDFMTASAPSARIHWLLLNDHGLGRRSRRCHEISYGDLA
jgi:hypothetical protein